MMGAEGQVTLSMKADNGGEVVMDSFVDMRLGPRREVWRGDGRVDGRR